MYTNTILNNLPFENIAGIHQPFPLAGLQSAEIIHPPTNPLIDILKQHANDYTKNHALPDHIIRTLRIINMCHTSALGGHVESCPDGHVSRIFYNSCGNRCCPRCAPRLRIGWLERRREVILPVQHFHVVITLAHTFNQLWKSNTKILGELFFHIAKEVLSDFLSDNRWLGADEIGMTITLETWDDRLFFHPHLHILVTGGGLSSEENWIDVPNPRILVHVKPLMWEFRKRFCAALKQMLRDGVLSLNDGSSLNYWIKRIKTAKHKKWAVFIAPPPEEGGPTTDDILRYQADDIAGGPLSGHRIVTETNITDNQINYLKSPALSADRIESCNGETVSFKWGTYNPTTSRRERNQIETLPIETFLDRYLQHIPPFRFQMVRHFGLYTGAKKKVYLRCRALLASRYTEPVESAKASSSIEDNESNENMDFIKQHTCPICHKALVVTQHLRSTRTGAIIRRVPIGHVYIKAPPSAAIQDG